MFNPADFCLSKFAGNAADNSPGAYKKSGGYEA
jgi:hypothetical protein